MARYGPHYLPGLEPKEPEPGTVKHEMSKQIEKLREDKLITEAHAGIVALALLAAENVDRMGQIGAPSGRANLLKATADVFAMLPVPPEGQSATVETIIAAIMADDDAQAV